jgi:predicted O-methyltransferase YrrM
MGTLRELFDKWDCDKGTKKHCYDNCYEQYFWDVKDDQLNLLEIGCFRGESTAAFLEYFPHATIYTIDIFERTHPDSLDVLKDERVKWLKYDSCHAALPNAIRRMWGNDIKFDFIIDDGAHWPEANRKTFENCFPFLKQDGVYFIEDVYMLDRDYAANDPWVKKQPDRYKIGEHIRLMNTIDKYDVKHYDYHEREYMHLGAICRNPDSYILRVMHGS